MPGGRTAGPARSWTAACSLRSHWVAAKCQCPYRCRSRVRNGIAAAELLLALDTNARAEYRALGQFELAVPRGIGVGGIPYAGIKNAPESNAGLGIRRSAD